MLLLIIICFFFPRGCRFKSLYITIFHAFDRNTVPHLILLFSSLLFATRVHYQQTQLIFHEDSILLYDLFAIHLNLSVCQIPYTLNPSMSWASKRGFYAKSLSNARQQDCPEGDEPGSDEHKALILVSVQGLQMRRVQTDFHANYESYVIKEKKKSDITLLSSLVCASKLQAVLTLQFQNIWKPVFCLDPKHWNMTEAQFCSTSTPVLERENKKSFNYLLEKPSL